MSIGTAESTARRLLRAKGRIDQDFAESWTIEELARITQYLTD